MADEKIFTGERRKERKKELVKEIASLRESSSLRWEEKRGGGKDFFAIGSAGNAGGNFFPPLFFWGLGGSCSIVRNFFSPLPLSRKCQQNPAAAEKKRTMGQKKLR